jgi:hypothetical protein
MHLESCNALREEASYNFYQGSDNRQQLQLQLQQHGDRQHTKSNTNNSNSSGERL